MKYHLFTSHGRRQFRVGITWMQDGIPRFRFLALEWQ